VSLLFPERRAPRAGEERANPGLPWNRYLQYLTTGSSVTRHSVTEVSVAYQHSVVYRCINKTAGTISTFPIDEMLRGARVDPSPIIERPSITMRRSVWLHAAAASLMARGNVYGLVDDDSMLRTGFPTSVELVFPDRVRWTAETGWLLDNEPIDEYPVGPLWHVPLHVLPGSPMGLNPIEYARRTIFAGLVAQEFGTNFLADGGHPSGILAPDKDPGPEGAKRLKERFQEATRGTTREPVVLPQSTKWTQIQISPQDSQFLESMRFSGEELCRFFGVIPEQVGVKSSGSSITYGNREQDKQNELQDSLMVALVRLEEGLTELLPRPRSAKINPDALLRSDLEKRYASYKVSADIYAQTGYWVVTPEEWRDLENRGPIPAEWGPPTPSEEMP